MDRSPFRPYVSAAVRVPYAHHIRHFLSYILPHRHIHTLKHFHTGAIENGVPCVRACRAFVHCGCCWFCGERENCATPSKAKRRCYVRCTDPSVMMCYLGVSTLNQHAESTRWTHAAFLEHADRRLRAALQIGNAHVAVQGSTDLLLHWCRSSLFRSSFSGAGITGDRRFIGAHNSRRQLDTCCSGRRR